MDEFNKLPKSIQDLGNTLFDRLVNYSNRCINGEEIVCQKHKWAAQRFLDDLNREDLYFDRTELVKFYIWARNFKHRAGMLAGTRIELTDFNLFEDANILCLKRVDTGLRKYRKIYLQRARKNMKTQEMAIISSYLQFNGGEQQEIYIAGWAKDQSSILFREMEFQYSTNDKLRGKYKNSYGKLTSKLDGSFVKPLSREARNTGDGTNPSVGICDEYHAHKSSEIYDVLLSGMVARQQPLMIIITTAGFSMNCPCRQEYKLVSKIIDPHISDVTNDEYFVLICELDKDDDPYDEGVWPKANPIVCTYEGGWNYLRGEAEMAKISPEKRRNFLTKNMDLWISMLEDGYMDMSKWDDCGRDFDWKDFFGYDCILGVDLSTKLDLTSIGFEFCRDGEYYVLSHSFMPEETYNKRLQEGQYPFDVWVSQGLLTVTPGAVIDYNEVKTYIKSREEEFGIRIAEVCYDPYNATHFISELVLDGYICIEVRQGALTLNEPTKDFRDKVYEDKLHHNGDGLLAWAMSNAVAEVKAQEYTMVSKAKSGDKIDPLAALINAHLRATTVLDAASSWWFCPEI